MILSVTVESFLNFEGTLVGEISRVEDNGKFTVLFGRNGSGKSSLVTAIIWCLFDKPKSSKKLINNNDFSKGTNHCSVTVRLYCQQETCSTIDVTKIYKIKGNSVTYRATYSTGHDTSDHFSPVTITNEVEIRSILQNKFNINTESIDRVYCAQSSEHLQSLKDPLELLKFVEVCIGTISLKQEYEFLQGRVAEKSDSILVARLQSDKNVASVTAMLPKVRQAFKFVKDSVKLNQELISIYTISLESLNKLLVANATEKQRIELSLETLKSEKCDQELLLVASSTHLDQCTIECEKIKKVVDQVTKLKKKLEINEQSESDLIAATNETISKLKNKHKYALGQLTAVQNKLAVNAKEINVLEADLCDNQQKKGEASEELSQYLDTDIHAVKRENSVIRSIKERYETTGVQTIMQTLQTKKTTRDEWSATNAMHTSSIEEIDAAIKELTRDLKTKELETIRFTTDISRLEQHALDINKGIICLRQQLQTRNNSIFLTNTRIKMNKLLSSVTVDCLILGNVVSPKQDKFTRAIIACVGYNRLPTTIIVATRRLAVDIADVAKGLDISGVLIEIIDEYDVSPSSNHAAPAIPAHFIPFMDCVTFLDKRVIPIFTQKYRNTYLFNGNANEMLAELHDMTDSSSHCSFASLDGCRVKPGGEIITSNQSHDEWPLVNTTKSDNTYKQVSVTEIEAELTHQYQAQSENSLRIHNATENKNKAIVEMKEMNKMVALKEGEKNAKLKKIIAISKCNQLQSEINNLEATLAKVNHSVSELSNQESARMQMLTNHPVFSAINKLLQQQLLATNSIDKLSIQRKILQTNKLYAEKRENDCKNNINSIVIQLETSNKTLNEATKSHDDIAQKLTTIADNFAIQSKKYEAAMKEMKTIKEERKLIEQTIKKHEFSMKLLQQDLYSIDKASATTRKNMETTQLKVDEYKQASKELKSCTLSVFHRRVVETYRSRKMPRVLDDDHSPRLILEDKVDGMDYYDSDDDDQDITFEEDTGDKMDLEQEATPVNDNTDTQKLYEKQLLLRQKVLVNSEMASSWKSVYKTYNSYCEQQVAARNHIKIIQDDIKVLLSSVHNVQAKRFEKISNSLHDISTNLTAIYKALVTESDCYLSYSNIGSILYEEGVEIFTSYSNHHYKEIKHLSGGQQSAVSLSLLFAIHSCFPSSVFIFDEIDASLDTRTVERLGIMIKNLSLKYNTSNFLVVSHRSEMIEMATRILGLYYSKTKPQIISKVF